MGKVGEKESITQQRIIKLFQDQLDYRYLGNWTDKPNNSNIEEDILIPFLKDQQGYSDTLINKAFYELTKVADDQNKSLYDLNKDVYTLLRYGIQIKEDYGENNQTVWLINWKEPLLNDFAIASEVTVKGKNTKRPDLVLYVNGIALGVLELKRSRVSVNEGIRQNLDNQDPKFIKHFFTTMQLVMAGNDTEGLRYGTIETKAKYFLTWKEESNIENPLDRDLLKLCQKERFLEIIHDFIVFDRGDKKLCRHNQYFGIKLAQENLQRREGGIIWHTQGSGKSLTMVWLTKWIRENIHDARVLIITDREELDDQIEKVFKGVNENIYRTQSGKDLIDKLNNTTPSLICSLIHKFGRKKENPDYDNYINELKSNLPKDFQAKGNLFILVDECHRTQSGQLHKAMKELLSNAVFIGFTGTPILKKDKLKSIEIFGNYIHTYKFNEAVEDKVILDLRYEARDIDQQINSQDKIDQWFEAKTRGLTEYAKTELKKRWGTLQKVLSSKSRLEKIVNDIILDMDTKDRLQNGRGNAILIAGRIYDACKYYDLFQSAGFTKCAIITSYNPSVSSIKGETTGEDNPTDKLTEYITYQKMLNGKTPEVFEQEVKKKFIEEPGQMKLLIVVDKLLTGFDAPPATYLYIDKSMQDHGLFQAICRVNRLDDEDKEYGYIVDYKDLFKNLEKAVNNYTNEAFGEYDPDDVKDLLGDRLTKGVEDLENARETIKALCDPVAPPKNTRNYIHYFCGSNPKDPEVIKDNQQKRLALYKYTSSLIRAYAQIANDMIEAGYTPAEIETIKQEVKYYQAVREEIKLASGDFIDLKQYEPAMRHLIDNYIGAQESKVISTFDDMTLIELIVKQGKEAVDKLPPGIKEDKEAVAETIENNLRKVITEEQATNPKYYEKMSILLEELIKARRETALEYQEYLRQIIKLSKKATQTDSSSPYPPSLNTPAKKALYDNLDQDEQLALTIDRSIRQVKKDSWRGNTIKEREIKNALKKHLQSQEAIDRIFELIKNQADY